MDDSAVCRVCTNHRLYVHELIMQSACGSCICEKEQRFRLGGVGERNYLGWTFTRSESSSIVDRICTMDMCPVSVRHSIVLFS